MNAGAQKEADGHIVEETSEISGTATPASTKFLTRKRKIILFIMVGVTSLALGLGLGIGLTRGCPTGENAAASASASPSATTTAAADVIQPSVGTTWDYPLGFSLTPSNANKSTIFYPVDLENTSSDTIAALKRAGHTIVCYFSAGSVESYRDDADEFPASAIGNTLDGWPDEKWVDHRNAKVRSIMAARIASAADKGCSGVDPDNIDGYANDSGFDYTEADTVDYVRFLADAAHDAGLAYGLKNAGAIVEQVVDVAEWAINEECAEYEECADWAPFIDAGKPVFHVEYVEDDDATSVSAAKKKKACAADGQKGFSSIIKHYTLDNWIVYC
ncbi:glycoside hydrolase superfamily [Xylaria bambusicola]|uniref:glycoside hydrolase superfamily n=1 Tax=Xylaria bambusicola TaxID=326684 RepID=UPI00200779B7|nr:glycoside hydrolase superfamily [Xylaria bambusicola]KAI0509517.1 glycoside hydrolase superfamily [Xylaria bambusicola]